MVIRNHPVDPHGNPFPTLYWLTCPEAAKAVARIEATGAIAELNARDRNDPVFTTALAEAHTEYAAERGRFHAAAQGWGGVGGTRRGVKCLHAHYANHLAGGDDPVGSMVAEQIEPLHGRPPGERVAAVDQGTNSTRLLVVERSGDETVEISRDMIITRLGKDVARTGRLAPDALARTSEVLERYCRRADVLHASRIRVTATSAVRDAANSEGFAETVRALTGEDLEVLSGEREADLTYRGAIDRVPARGLRFVLDIGGGSTEFVLGSDVPDRSVSVQMGSVRLTERFILHDPATPEELADIRREIEAVLDRVQADLPVNGGTPSLVAVAGTATTVQAISLDLPRYDPDVIHGSILSRREAESVLDRLRVMTVEEKGALPVMAAGRADVILAGAEILVAVMRRWGFEQAVVSEHDILDGLAAEMLTTR